MSVTLCTNRLLCSGANLSKVDVALPPKLLIRVRAMLLPDSVTVRCRAMMQAQERGFNNSNI